MKQKIALADRLDLYLQLPEAQSVWEISGAFHIWRQKMEADCSCLSIWYWC